MANTLAKKTLERKLSDTGVRKILLVVEENSGELADISKQLVSAALKLRNEWGCEISAFLPAGIDERTGMTLAKLGPEIVYRLDHPLMKEHPHEVTLQGLLCLQEEIDAGLILFGASEWGTDMAARTAARLGTGLLHELIGFDLEPENEALLGIFMGFEDQLVCKAQFSGSKPFIATVKPKVFDPASETDRAGRVKTIKLPFDIVEFKSSITQILPSPADMPDLESAEVVIAGGQGVGGEEGFAVLENLARLLGGAIGCTLPPVEQGWIDRELMIGSTGKTVRPGLYIGCGIHGDVYHTSGMDESGRIVVINDDEKAPFFDLATCGLIGDLHEIVPRLIEEIRDQIGS